MSRRRFLQHCLHGAGLPLLAPLAAPAAPLVGKPLHILMITFRGETDVDKGFRAYLAEAGLQVRYTVRDVQQDVGRIPAILEEARALAPDLIYVWGTPITLAVVGAYDDPDRQHFIHDIPVVFALVAAPVRSRIVENLEAPGRNVTGFMVRSDTSAIRTSHDTPMTVDEVDIPADNSPGRIDDLLGQFIRNAYFHLNTSLSS